MSTSTKTLGQLDREIAALEGELAPLAPTVMRIKQAVLALHAKQQLEPGSETIARVLVEDECARYSTRARRYILTEKGVNFARQIRKYN